MNTIEKQYKTPENLNTRISIHEAYSINPQPFGDWITSHYDIRPGNNVLELGCGTGTSFTLQNGGQILSRYFDSVQRLDREDGLAITRLEDFADYVYSLSGLSNIAQVPRDVLLHVLAQNTKNDILYVPKEYGMFICT